MLVLFALTAPMIIGLGALGSEGGLIYMKKTTTQSVADMAAISAANALSAGGASAAQIEAKGIAALAGYVDGQNGVTVTVNTPPTSGAKAGNAKAVEVIVEATQPPMLSKIVHSTNYIMRGRTVASGGMAAGCMIALDATASWGISVGGTAVANIGTCAVYSNTPGTSSLTSNGGGTLTANTISAVGTIAGVGISATTTLTGQPAIANPYSYLTVPSFSGCGPNLSSSTYSATLEPGVYCGGLTVNSGMQIRLNPGVYIIDQGALKLTGGSITGSGVTIILTSSTGKKYAYASIGGNVSINITAPTTGPYAGVVVYSDAPAGTGQTFGGGNGQYFGGAIVAPSSMISFGGSGASSNGHSCTQLIGAQISFNGNVAVDNDCSGFGTRAIGGGQTAIVE